MSGRKCSQQQVNDGQTVVVHADIGNVHGRALRHLSDHANAAMTNIYRCTCAYINSHGWCAVKARTVASMSALMPEGRG